MGLTHLRRALFIVPCIIFSLSSFAQLGCIATTSNDDNYDGIVDTYAESKSLYNAMGKIIVTNRYTDFLNDGSIDFFNSETTVYDDYDRVLSVAGRRVRQSDGALITSSLSTYEYPNENVEEVTTTYDFDLDENIDFRVFGIYEYSSGIVTKVILREDSDNDGNFNNEKIIEYEVDGFGGRHIDLETIDNDFDGNIDYSKVGTITYDSDKVEIHYDIDQDGDNIVDDTFLSTTFYVGGLIASRNGFVDQGVDGIIDVTETDTYTYTNGNNTGINYTRTTLGQNTTSTDVVRTFDADGNIVTRTTSTDNDGDGAYDRSVEDTYCLSEIPTIEVNIRAGDVIINQENAIVHLNAANGSTFGINANNDGSLSVNASATPYTKNMVEGGHIYFSAQNNLVLRSDANTLVAVGVDNDGNISTSVSTSSSGNTLVLPSGNLGLNGTNAGLLFKSPDGNCWKVFVDTSGNLETTSISCPD